MHTNTSVLYKALFSFPVTTSSLIDEWSEVAQSCPTLCDPMDCSLPGSIHEIFQARILEWVAISFSRGSSRSREWTWVSRISGRRFTVWATRGAFSNLYVFLLRTTSFIFLFFKILFYFFAVFSPHTLNLLFCIGVQLINNIVVVSGNWWRDSAIHIYVSILPQIPLLSRLPHN